MTAKNSEPARSFATHDPLSHRIGELERERAELEEEVLQLRAAVQIWTAVRRQVMTTAAREALDREMR